MSGTSPRPGLCLMSLQDTETTARASQKQLGNAVLGRGSVGRMQQADTQVAVCHVTASGSGGAAWRACGPEPHSMLPAPSGAPAHVTLVGTLQCWDQREA